MEQVDLNRYGFIQSVNLCITLLEEFGNKLTPDELDKFLGEHTKSYMNSEEFLAAVVDAIEKGGDDFVNKMSELYKIKDEILKVIEPKNLYSIIEGEARKVGEELVLSDGYIEKLADFCLASPRFRDYMYSYTKQAVSLAIKNLNLEEIVSKIVADNADRYSELLLFSTKQKQLMAEASLLCTLSIEKLLYARYKNIIYSDDFLHPQGNSKKGVNNE